MQLMDNQSAPSREPPGAGRCGEATATVLRYLVLAAVLVLGVVGGAGMTRPSSAGWAVMILAAMALWAGWLYWRAVLGDRDVPAHLLHPFAAAAVIVLLGHLLLPRAAGRAAPAAILGSIDSDLLMRLMTLSLLVLLAQDVLGRVVHMRWMLTGLGGFVAAGAVLRLCTSPSPAGAPAVTLGGLAGVGMLLAPLRMPEEPAERLLPFVPDSLRRYGAVARIGAAALLAALLVVRHPGCAAGGVVAAAAAGAALLLAGGIFPGRRRLLASGAVLAACAAAGVVRLGLSVPPWLGSVRLWGEGVVPIDPASAGVWTIGASAGWVGVALLAGGIVTALVRSLWACRLSAPGDQGRAALWAAVVLVAGCSLLAPGGLTVPSAAVVAAIALGLMPHMMVHRVRRFHGWVVVCAFAVTLAVMGLQRMLCPTAWSILAARYGDGPLHLFGTFVLAGVLFWQLARGRFAAAAACAVAAAAVASMGELAQRLLSTRTPQWSDVVWNCLGAAGALAVFGLIRAAAMVEGLLAARPRVSKEGYETWRHVTAGGAFPSAGRSRPPSRPQPPGPAPSPRTRSARSDPPEGSDRQSRSSRRR